MRFMGRAVARPPLGDNARRSAQTEEERQFDGFQSWIENKFKMRGTHSWAKIILFYSMDEKDALDNFFKLFEEFLTEMKNSANPQPRLKEAVSA